MTTVLGIILLSIGGLLLEHSYLYFGVAFMMGGNNFLTGVWGK